MPCCATASRRIQPKAQLAFRLNGELKTVLREPQRLLIDLLRDELGLTGTKEGCGIGVCGSCSVLIDGRLMSACLVLVATLDGRSVETIEGLTRGKASRLEEAFVSCGGFQCGICTPGQIVAAAALLDENPQPAPSDVRAWMTGNLCRCTGYGQIVDAILRAAEET